MTETQVIRGGGFDGRIWELRRKGKPVRMHTVIRNFRDEPHLITGGRPPHKPGSTGRVWTDHGEFFPSVVDAEWVPISR